MIFVRVGFEELISPGGRRRGTLAITVETLAGSVADVIMTSQCRSRRREDARRRGLDREAEVVDGVR